MPGRRGHRRVPNGWVVRWPVWAARRLLILCVYRPFLRCFLRGWTVEGQEHIPSGPVIYAAAHTSMADTPLLLWALGPRARWVVVTAARDFFFRRERPLFGIWVGVLFGAVPIDRVKFARRSLRDAATWLRSGFSLVIYPHGTIPDGPPDAAPLHRGVARLMKQTGCSVVPVRIEGAGMLLPPGVHWPRRAAVRVTFLLPLLPLSDENYTNYTERLAAALFGRNDESQ